MQKKRKNKRPKTGKTNIIKKKHDYIFPFSTKYTTVAPAFRERSLAQADFYSADATRIVLWCNGNTTGFGSVIPGSNPGSTTPGKGI